MKRVAMVLILASMPANAQVVCTTTYGTVFCNDIGRSFDKLGEALDDVAAAQQRKRDADVAAAQQRKRDAEAAEQDRIDRSNRQYVERSVGEKISKRHCAGAEDVALKWGFFDLVEQVRRLC